MLILKSKALNEPIASTGGMIEVYHKEGFEKRGHWSTPTAVLSVDLDARTVSIPGSRNREVTVCFENIRPAPEFSDFVQLISEAIDTFDQEMDIYFENPDYDELQSSTDTLSHLETKPVQNENFDTANHQISRFDADSSTNEPNIEPRISDHIAVFWPLDDTYYNCVFESEKKDGKLVILYDDHNAKECLDMSCEPWKYTDGVASASCVQIQTIQSRDLIQNELIKYEQHIGNMPFLKHESQCFEQFPVIGSSKEGE